MKHSGTWKTSLSLSIANLVCSEASVCHLYLDLQMFNQLVLFGMILGFFVCLEVGDGGIFLEAHPGLRWNYSEIPHIVTDIPDSLPV